MSSSPLLNHQRPIARVLLWGGIVVSLLAVVAVGTVMPDAGPGTYTVEPEDQPKDRRPGQSAATWNHFVVANVSIELESVEFRQNAGSFADCSESAIDTFGVDRGNDTDGTTVDESLLNRTDRVVNGPNRLQFEFDDEANTSRPTLDDGDELVTVPRECFQNPDDPGWYRFTAWLNGSEANGNRSFTLEYWEVVGVCNCESEEEAREQLGPPIGTPTQTNTPIPSATPTRTSTATSTPTNTPTPSTTPSPTTFPTTEAPRTPTGSPTPTPGIDDGFGGFTSIVAVAIIALGAIALIAFGVIYIRSGN